VSFDAPATVGRGADVEVWRCRNELGTGGLLPGNCTQAAFGPKTVMKKALTSMTVPISCGTIVLISVRCHHATIG
jgi:hypothetical protein